MSPPLFYKFVFKILTVSSVEIRSSSSSKSSLSTSSSPDRRAIRSRRSWRGFVRENLQNNNQNSLHEYPSNFFLRNLKKKNDQSKTFNVHS